jgi:hypothetical protein
MKRRHPQESSLPMLTRPLNFKPIPETPTEARQSLATEAVCVTSDFSIELKMKDELNSWERLASLNHWTWIP